jgi:sugar-specific transcriptional regulator TrmB
LSLKRIIKVLASLGLSQTDAQIYIYLATNGSNKARAIVDYLNINRGQVYKSLKRLQSKGTIISSDEHPIEFSALPFEHVLDMLMKIKKEQAKILQESKEALIADFRSEKKKSNASN